MSESLAKMQLKDVVGREHVEEAHRLFKVSTLHAAKSGMSSNFSLPDELKDDVKRVQDVIRRKFAIEYAIYGMIKNQEIKNFENRRILQRIK